MHEIAAAVGLQHRLSLGELRLRTQAYRISHPRQEAMAMMMEAGFSTGQIKRFFGLKDHATVLHASKAVAARSERAG